MESIDTKSNNTDIKGNIKMDTQDASNEEEELDEQASHNENDDYLKIKELLYKVNDTDSKIIFSNLTFGKLFFNRILSYLSEQFFYRQTHQKNKYDENIKTINNRLTDLTDNNNVDYRISSIGFSGKNLCSVDIGLHTARLFVIYQLPYKFKKKFEKDCNDNDDLVVEYIIETTSKSFNESVVKETDISEYKEIIFYPKNKLSFKYFELFISGIMNYKKKGNKNYLHSNTDMTVYINVDSYWEELCNRPTRSIESIYLPKEEKKKILDDFTWFFSKKTQTRYEQLGRNYKRVVLFEGVPGSGKTSLALAIASHFNYDLAILSFTDKVTDGTFTRLVRQMPEKTILLLEDIDCLFHERKNNDNYKNQVTFSGILNTLDGIATPHEFICIITTNYKNLLDDAILRPGRIDSIVKFDYAKRSQIRDIYKVYMGDNYCVEKFKKFYKAYQELNIECTVSLIQEYLFKFLDKPEDAFENIDEIKVLKEQSTKKKADVYM